MPKIKDTILDWTVLGAWVATSDGVIQANFFKGFAAGLREMDTTYERQVQFASVRTQKSDHGIVILSDADQKILSESLQMLWPEE
ncbi:MAG: hypothetical protein WC455_14670 [Dehalococcoidia bacterium]|jgi:hypothetical protein